MSETEPYFHLRVLSQRPLGTPPEAMVGEAWQHLYQSFLEAKRIQESTKMPNLPKLKDVRAEGRARECTGHAQ